jgi:hypothetical protein
MLKAHLVAAVIRALQLESAAAPAEPSREWLAWVERKRARAASEGASVPVAREIVLRAMPVLAAMGEHGNLTVASSRYLPRLIVARGLAEGCHFKYLDRAARKLVAEGLIERVVVGRYNNRTRRYGLALRPRAT